MKKSVMVILFACLLIVVGGCNKKQEIKKEEMKVTSTEIYDMNEEFHKEGLKTVLEYSEGDYQVIYTVYIPLDENRDFDKSVNSIVNVDVKKGTETVASNTPKIGEADATLTMEDEKNIRLHSEFDVIQNDKVVLEVRDDVKLNFEKESDTYKVTISE